MDLGVVAIKIAPLAKSCVSSRLWIKSIETANQMYPLTSFEEKSAV